MLRACGVLLGVDVGVGIGVSVEIRVGVSLGLGVGIGVSVGDGVGIGVSVGDGVGVGVGRPARLAPFEVVEPARLKPALPAPRPQHQPLPFAHLSDAPEALDGTIARREQRIVLAPVQGELQGA